MEKREENFKRQHTDVLGAWRGEGEGLKGKGCDIAIPLQWSSLPFPHPPHFTTPRPRPRPNGSLGPLSKSTGKTIIVRSTRVCTAYQTLDRTRQNCLLASRMCRAPLPFFLPIELVPDSIDNLIKMLLDIVCSSRFAVV